ncbi:MAG: hypothetical protein IPL36_10665 [Nigerium sp.]|nr:hypothetical protein [Nigerium sp.]
MLAVVAFLVATGAAGGGVIGYALLCMAMMGAMMLFIEPGHPLAATSIDPDTPRTPSPSHPDPRVARRWPSLTGECR